MQELIPNYKDMADALKGREREFFGGKTETEITEKMDARAAELNSEIPGGVTVANRRKVGRNEPCPCGSGSKFKKCCIDRLR